MDMIFDFQRFITELRETPEKEYLITDFEKYYGKINGGIEEQNWFIEYVSKFSKFYKQFKLPEECLEDFDWVLLFSLNAASFSTDTSYLKPNKTIVNLQTEYELEITVNHDDGTSISKKLSELWGFQVFRLYEIYIEEQIAFQTRIADSDNNNSVVIWKERIKRYEEYEDYSERITYFDKKEPKNTNSQNLLYHYTSVSTIHNIIKSKCLWATDITKLNDKKEQKIWYEIFDKVIESYISKEDYFEHKEIIEAIELKISEYKENYDSYITSFSTKEDLLSQWRAYGDDGEGICIAFEASEFLDLLYSDGKNENLYNGDLDYNYKSVYEDTYKIIFKILSDFSDKNVPYQEYSNRVDSLAYFNEMCEAIWLRIQDSKDSSFFEENEFRLFLHENRKRPTKTVDTFERNKRVISFVKIEFGQKQFPIKKIILGPACREKEDLKNGIEKLLKNHGYTVTDNLICNSQVPYRK